MLFLNISVNLNDYCGTVAKHLFMSARTTSSSQVLLIILLVITFPLWFSIGAMVFGILAGVAGALIGVIGGLFGMMVGLIALPFKILFGWGHSGWGFFWSPAFFISLVILLVWMAGRNRK